MTVTERPFVEVYVDPVCPFAWITSRWLVEVARLGRIELRFRVMSLSVLNEGRNDISDFYRDLVDRAWGTARLAIATEQKHGEAAFARLYEVLVDPRSARRGWAPVVARRCRRQHRVR
jgi:predicted DsbA family dithiol-disulfide isomerase